MADLASLGYGRDIFGPEHEEFRKTARRFFQTEIEPNTSAWEKTGMFPAELFRKAGEYGLLCAGMPEAYGGLGGDVLHHVILHEEHGFSPAGASLEGGLCIDSVTYTLLNNGTEEQKREWLPKFATGEVIAEVAISEAGAGSDVQGTKTWARRDGDDYVINGAKMWLTNGPILNLVFVIAKMEAEPGTKPKFSMFIVPVNTKGITVSSPTELMVKGCGALAEMYFDDVRVPASSLMGGVAGRGLPAAFSTLALGRLVVAARSIASSELGIALTTDYVRQRRAFGQAIFDFQNTQFKLATAKAQARVGRVFVDSLLAKLLRGDVDPTDAAIAKLTSTETEFGILDECLQLFGGFGFSNEFPISKMFAAARGNRIKTGSSEIMRMLIGRSL
jgi:acyl-CoA dehydrogenase